MNLLTYVNELIAQREQLKLINSGNGSVDAASSNSTYISANAKSEQIVDCLVSLYNMMDNVDNKAGAVIRNYLKNTYYIHALKSTCLV